VCGPWTLYRNDPTKVNDAFRYSKDWMENLRNPATTGWGEDSFSKALESRRDAGRLRLKYGSLHRYTVEDYAKLRLRDGQLTVEDEEIMMFHFRRRKEYPIL
jgi:hypothetical protein